MADEQEPRRLLIATATARYRHQPAWDRPGLVQARQDIIDLFTQQLGYQQVTNLRLDPTKDELTRSLRTFCRSTELREDDQVAVYISGHGEVLDEQDGGGHVLLTHDTDPEDLADALQTEQLARKLLLGTRIRRLLLMLDTCYSGQGSHELTATALAGIGSRWAASPSGGLAIISSTQPMGQATTGHFPRLLREAVRDLGTPGRAPADLTLGAVVTRMNRHPGHQRIGLTMVGLSGEVPPFLTVPRRSPQLGGSDPAQQQDLRWQQEADRREVELASRLLVRAKGFAPGSGWWFTGRTAALGDLTGWLTSPSDRRVGHPAALAVTGGPGTGKTAVLGLLAALAHPQARHTVPAAALDVAPATVSAAETIDVAVYAQGLTDDQVLSAMCASAQVQAATVGDLLDRLGSRPRPLTVLVDGLDEAATPDSLCALVLRPLVHQSGKHVRLLLGTRPHLLPRLDLEPGDQIDLDADRYADPGALTTYAARNLIHAHPDSPYRRCPAPLLSRIARDVATAAGGSFLVARLSAGVLAATPGLPDPDDERWRTRLPRRADEAVTADLLQRLGREAAKAVDLLRPLAYAQGQGLPWQDVWAHLAEAISKKPYTDDDIRWLRDSVGSHIVDVVEAERLACRLYHQAIADHLRAGKDDVAVHAAIAHALTGQVPQRVDGTRAWDRAHPYTIRHLAAHAAHGGILDGLLTDPEYLVHADPDGLVPHLRQAAGASRVAAAVYLASVGTHSRATPQQRRQILALDAARYNDAPMLALLNSHAAPGTWRPLHSTSGGVSTALRNVLTGHADRVEAVACTVLDGRTVAVTGSADCTVRVWDLTTGRPVGLPIEVTGGVNAIACSHLDGRPVAVTACRDNTTQVLDLTAGRANGEPLGCSGWVRAVACTVLDGRPVAVTAGQDSTAQVWDLTTGRSVGPPVEHDSSVESVACAVLGGRPVAVTSSGGRNVKVWDLATGHAIGRPFAQAGGKPFGWVAHVACTMMGDQPVVVTGSTLGTVRVWDPATGHPMGPALREPTGITVFSLACTLLEGRRVVVTGTAGDHAVRMWDLDPGESSGAPRIGHTDHARAVTCTSLDGRPVAVTASGSISGPAFGSDYNHVVRTWDLSTGQPVGRPLEGHTDHINAIACTVRDGRAVAVTGAEDRTVRVWDLATRRAVGRPLTNYHRVDAVACTVLEGRPVAVACSSESGDMTVWDLNTGQAVRELRGHRAITVACTVLAGRPIAVTGSHDNTAWLWDLATGEPIGRPLTGHGHSVCAVACTEVDGRAVAVTGSLDRTVRLWDLASGQSMGRPLVGHTESVKAVTCTVLNGRPIAVTSSGWYLGSDDFTGSDHAIRVWDLLTLSSTVIELPAACTGVATAGQLLVCTFGKDIATFELYSVKARPSA